jgi:hypothetical protein
MKPVPPSPLFITGTARSGTNLVTRMLDNHPAITLAVDPYFPLFRWLRNAAVAQKGSPAEREGFEAGAPLQDYYFSAARLRWMDLVQAADLELPLPAEQAARMLEQCRARTALECPDLVPRLDQLRGGTFRELFDRGLEIIAQVRGSGQEAWLGCKEVWTVEFFAALARAYPQARFIVIHRHPAAVAASNQALITQAPEQVGHPLSYLRHWRKTVAFCQKYQQDPLLAGRLFTLTFEDLLAQPASLAQRMCAFLGVEFDPAMLATDRFQDHATGGAWRGNSSFQAVTEGIDAQAAQRWRSRLDPAVRKLASYVCGPEMGLAGYAPDDDALAGGQWPAPEVLRALLDHHRRPASWRSDLGDPQADFGGELFRRALLEQDPKALDPSLVRRSFLFTEVLAALRGPARGEAARHAL